jgi:hypothetical protein
LPVGADFAPLADETAACLQKSRVRWKGRKFTDEQRRKVSEGLKRMWADPEFAPGAASSPRHRRPASGNPARAAAVTIRRDPPRDGSRDIGCDVATEKGKYGLFDRRVSDEQLDARLTVRCAHCGWSRETKTRSAARAFRRHARECENGPRSTP